MTHPLERVPGGAPSYYRFCECGRNITSMTPSAVKEHLATDLHFRWMNWDEHVRKISQQNAEKHKERREKGAYNDYNSARLANDRAEGYKRQREWKAEVTECECGCVVTKGKLAEHRKTKKHINRLAAKEEKPPN